MELSRFHRAIHVISEASDVDNLNTRLGNIVAALNQVAASPGSPDYIKAFRDQVDAFQTYMAKSALNEPEDPDVAETITALGLTDHVGLGLFSKVIQTINVHQLTPQLVSSELEKLRGTVITRLRLVETVDDAFGTMEVDYERLEPGNAEMKITTPFALEVQTLEDLSKEVREWDKICRPISETFDPDRTVVSVRTVSSGSLLLYLAGTAAFIWGVSKCLKGVNSVLAEAIRMKSLYAELVKSKYPQETLKSIDAHNQGKIKTDLQTLAADLVDRHYAGTDEGRKSELKNDLSGALHRLTKKLADGAAVKLRITAPKKPKVSDGQPPTEEQEAALRLAEDVEKLRVEVKNEQAALLPIDASTIAAALPSPDTLDKEGDKPNLNAQGT